MIPVPGWLILGGSFHLTMEIFSLALGLGFIFTDCSNGLGAFGLSRIVFCGFLFVFAYLT
jgi:hypothetical protein